MVDPIFTIDSERVRSDADAAGITSPVFALPADQLQNRINNALMANDDLLDDLDSVVRQLIERLA